MDLTGKAECFSVAVRIFHSLMEENRNLLHASTQAFEKLRRIVSHCKVLFQFVRTKMVNEEQSVVNTLLAIITPGDLVSFLSFITEVCYRQSNLSDAYLFSTLSSDFITYLSDTQDDKLQKAKHFGERGNVHWQLGQFCQAKEYHEKSLAITKEIYGEHHGDVAQSYNNL